MRTLAPLLLTLAACSADELRNVVVSFEVADERQGVTRAQAPGVVVGDAAWLHATADRADGVRLVLDMSPERSAPASFEYRELRLSDGQTLFYGRTGQGVATWGAPSETWTLPARFRFEVRDGSAMRTVSSGYVDLQYQPRVTEPDPASGPQVDIGAVILYEPAPAVETYDSGCGGDDVEPDPGPVASPQPAPDPQPDPDPQPTFPDPTTPAPMPEPEPTEPSPTVVDVETDTAIDASSGGCEGESSTDTTSSSGGCQGDSSTDTTSSSGGCEGDSGSSASSSSGGCDGDSSSSSSSCEGDAAPQHARRKSTPLESTARLAWPVVVAAFFNRRLRRLV